MSFGVRSSISESESTNKSIAESHRLINRLISATCEPTTLSSDEIAKDFVAGLSKHILRQPRERLANHEGTTRAGPSSLPEDLANPVGFCDV